MADASIILATIVCAVGRFMISPRLDIPTAEGCYETFVHLFVGGLIGAWLMRPSKWIWLAIPIALSLLEIVCFTVQKSAH